MKDALLTHDSALTVIERAQSDPEFARALLDEAATLFVNGEPGTARIVLRDLVEATVGFDTLATETSMPIARLRSMLSKAGSPSMDTVASILMVVRTRLGVDLQVHVNAAA